MLGVSIIGRDISARLTAEREMERHNDDLQVMNLVTTAVNQVLQADEMVERAMLTLCNSSILDGVGALVPDNEGGFTLTVCERRGAVPRQHRFAPGPETDILLEQMEALLNSTAPEGEAQPLDPAGRAAYCTGRVYLLAGVAGGRRAPAARHAHPGPPVRLERRSERATAL